jgi:PAS domain S-box-containing protein
MRKIESFNILLQNIRETIYIGKVNGDPSCATISYISDNVERLLGYKPEDFYKDPELWYSIIHPEDIEDIRKKVRNIFLKDSAGTHKSQDGTSQEKKVVRLTYRIRHKGTKKYRWVEDAISAHFDEQGRKTGIIGSLIDVTDLLESREGSSRENRSSVGKEKSFVGMFEKATVGVYRTTPDGEILYVNQALLKMLAFRSFKEIKDRNLNKGNYEPQYSREDFMRRIDSEGVVSGLESTWKKRDGSLLSVRESARAVRDEEGSVLYYEGTIEDLTEGKRAQERIVRLNQTLRTLANISQLIVRNSTPEAMFEEACRILVKDGKYHAAWIGVLDESHRVVHPIAWDGIDDGNQREVIVAEGGKPGKNGLIREAIRTGSACVSNDLWADPGYKTWRGEARRKGYRSAGAFPIHVSGKVVGVVNTFANMPDWFTSEEIHLLSELADDIGFALWTTEVRAREKAANDVIKDREFWLAESQRVANVGSYIFDVKTKSFTGSPMLGEIFGLGSGFDLDMDGLVEMVRADERDRVRKYFRKVLTEKGSCDLEFRILRIDPSGKVPNDKEQRWVWFKGELMFDSAGDPVSMFGTIQDVTDRKQAEEAHRTERILLRTLIDSLPSSVYVLDTECRARLLNAAAVRTTAAKSEKEVLGKTDFDLWPKEIAERFFADDQMVIKGGVPLINKEEQFTGSDGNERWQLTIKLPFRDANGAIIGLVGIGTDITDRKRIEDKLRESEDRFRAIFENSSVGIYRTTPDGRVILANPAMVRILGFRSFDELAKCNLEEEGRFFPEFPRAKFRELVESKGTVTGFESRQKRKDGSAFWARESASAVYDVSGRVSFYDGTLEDISEHRQAEEALEREKSLLRTLIESLPYSIFIKDKEYRKTVVNRLHLQHLAEESNRPELESESAILGKTDFDIYPKELAEEYFLDDQKVIRYGETILDREEPRVGPDGKKSWISVSKIPLRDKSGELNGLLGIISYITDRKLADEERERERILLRTLIDHLPDSVFVKDREYKKILANRAHVLAVKDSLKSFGLNPDKKILGRTDFEVYPEKSAEEFFIEDSRVIEDGATILEREDLSVDVYGNKHWTMISKVPLRDEKGNITGLLGISTDITPRKMAEEALRASEAELRALFGSMKDIVFVLDGDGRYVRIAPTNPNLLNKPPHELVGKTLGEVFEPQLAGEFLSLTREVLRTSELQNIEYKLEIGGKDIWFNASCSKMNENNVLVVARDITAHKQAEEALRRSEESLKQITDSIDDAIYSIDGTTAEFTYLSPVFERKLGYSLADIKAMGGRWEFLKKVIQSDNLPQEDPIIAELQTRVVSESPTWEQWWKCKDGSLLYLQDRSVPIYEDGQLIRIDGVFRDITEWRISEDAKQRERILLRTLIDNIPYPIYVKDKEYRKVIANPADVYNVGLHSESEVLGKTDFDLFPKEVADEFFEHDRAVIQDGKSVLNKEEYFYGPDGKKRWLLTTKIPLLDENHNIVGLVGIGADITERKAIEEALRQSETELRTLFESMKDIILVLDKDGRFLKVSPTDDSLLYRPGSEIIGKKQIEIFPKEQAEYFLSIIRKTLEGGNAQNVEYAIDIRGEEKWRAATVSVLTKDSVLWVARDITDRKLMEKEIEESEKKYRELVENALVGVYRATMSGRMIYANRAMADMLEYDSARELMVMRSFDLFKNDDEKDRFMQQLRNYGRTDKSSEAEFVTKTGKVRNVLLGASLDGEIISGMAKDITEIRTLERQFAQTQKLEGLGNIAAGIAHDFNNILGVILGYADLLAQSAFDPRKFERGTQAIMKSAERGKSLVKQLLTFARKTETTFGSVRVNEIISEIQRLMEETFPKTIVVTTNLRDDLPVFSGDTNQIHQVLLNVCVNARDAMPKGGTLTISTDLIPLDVLAPKFADATAKRYVQILLKDNGMGMDDEIRRRIFEPFFTTKEVGKGTGLGLSVVYGIMQSHRGFIDVVSTSGEGTTFAIYFPVFEGTMEDDAISVDQSTDDIPGGTDTVLIIEDEDLLRDLLRAMLESKGYEILSARDGQEGVQTYRNNRDRIALVLSDLGLPKLSGEEVVSFVKQANPEAKVIIASGFIDPNIRAGLEEAGVVDFIQKPYKAYDVLKTVRNVIDRDKV